ncbi:alpha-1,2-fucosyltransferase [Solidesulfovibrio sp.]|uniref:alpha-1,2-fucosyltransferase n=1 Tax=Solidesulfovibrio sp. TaxID=2910990 RepID=UPI00262C406F|nr:alpha-1,2-fucosyltransferase [Solidesulfovibrio sp.]
MWEKIVQFFNPLMTRNNKICLKLQGGLGNQMFQYAAAKNISLLTNTPLVLDISSFSDDPLSRKYRLSIFKIGEKIEKKPGIENDFKYRYNDDTSINFDAKFFNTRKNTYLSGYFQNEQYFSRISETIKNIFSFSSEVHKDFKKLHSLILNSESVCILFRRCDYTAIPKYKSFHETCNADYYYTAIKKILQCIPHPIFFCFSDDPQWVEDNINIRHPMHIIDWKNLSPEDADYTQLYLISCCKHHILANSSFAWWGAWLSPHTKQQIYVPSLWYRQPEYQHINPSLKTWNKIDVDLYGHDNYSTLGNL